MKSVKWQDQERVDQNDMEAQNDFLVGEFRRLVRAALLTSETTTGIIRGFKVEPQAVPDFTVRVRLNPGTQPGAAVLAENDGSIITRGQLAGDRGAQAALEGNASYTIDFSADAPGTYVVEATFLYSDGESDNRAFWNDSTNLEYISSVPTRRLPTLSIVRRASAAGGEWTTLASVVWTGANITSGAITDKRDLLFEGIFPNFQTTQSGTGGMPDFDRGAARADVTNDAVYSALRKVGRQIQDLKGPNAAGQWDFHSRVLRPMDPSNLLGSGVTKSIATLDTLEYTIGDGTTTWGDFSGSTGLQLCLTHIQAAQAVLPQRIRIRLKSMRTAISNTEIWAITTGLTLTTSKHIEIIGDLSGAGANERVPVKFSETATSFNFTATPAGALTLCNIHTANVPAASVFIGGDSGRIHLDNVLLSSQSVTISANHTQSKWRNSEIYGEIRISADPVYSEIDGLVVENCRFGTLDVTINATPFHVDGYMRFWRGTTTLIANATTFSNKALFKNCEFFYGGNTTAASVNREACVDMRGAAAVTFENCNYVAWADSNLILLGNSGVDQTNGSEQIGFNNCVFRVSGSFASASRHNVLAGYNGAEGTGWCVFGETKLSTTTITSGLTSCFMRSISFKNCVWDGCPQIDSGGVKLKNGAVSCSVENCTFESVTFPVDTGFAPIRRLYYLSFVHDAHYTGYTTSNISISNCQFGRVTSSDAAAYVPDVRHVNLTRVHDVKVDKCVFACSTLAGNSNKTVWSNGTSEMFGVITSRCFDVHISKCTFQYFPGTVLAAAIAQSGTDTSTYASRFSVLNCHFETCTYGLLFINPTRSVITFDGNTFDAFASNTARLFKANTKIETGSVVRFRDNTVLNPPGATWTVVELGDPARVVFMGNDLSNDGRIIHDSGMPGFVVGWNTTPQMNLVAAWA